MTPKAELLVAIAWFLATVLLAIVGWRDPGVETGRRRTIMFARLGVLATFLVGLTTFGLEMLHRQSEATEEVERTKRMVEEIQRVLGKMDFVRVSFEVSLSAVHPDLERYRVRLLQEAANCLPSAARGDSAELAAVAVSTVCLPREEENPIAHTVLSVADLCLDLFKEPIAPEAYEPCRSREGPRPDLSVKIFADSEEGLALEYDDQRQRFVLQALNRESISQRWKGNAAIRSVSDLKGAQMFVSFTNLAQGVRDLEEIYGAAEIDSLALSSGSPGVDIDLSTQTMRRQLDKRGMPFYYTYFSVDPISGDMVSSSVLAPP